MVCLTVLFSVLSKASSGVLLGVGGAAVAFYLIGMLPKIKDYSPASLMQSAGLLAGTEGAGDYLPSVIVAAALCVFSVAVSIPLMNKKKI
jgi:ABC-2 type transport system permease protein